MWLVALNQYILQNMLLTSKKKLNRLSELGRVLWFEIYYFVQEDEQNGKLFCMKGQQWVYGVIVNDTFLLYKIYNSLLIIQFLQLKEVIWIWKRHLFQGEKKQSWYNFQWYLIDGGYGVNATFNNISVTLYFVEVSFIDGGNRRKPPTCRRSLTNIIR